LPSCRRCQSLLHLKWQHDLSFIVAPPLQDASAGETGQEALYLRSLSDRQVVVTIKLRDGETVRGWIEYFDDAMLRLTREGQPNLFIYKHQIRSISEAGRKRAPRPESGAGQRRTVQSRAVWFPRPRVRRVRIQTVRLPLRWHLERRAGPEFAWVPKASAIAEEAGARLREFLAQGVETEYKGDVDLVTVADRTAEKLIKDRLGVAFPEHGVFGEEGTRERLEANFAGMWTRWTGPPTLPTGCRSFAFRWVWNSVLWGPSPTRTERLWPRSSTIPCGTSFLPPSEAAAPG